MQIRGHHREPCFSTRRISSRSCGRLFVVFAFDRFLHLAAELNQSRLVVGALDAVLRSFARVLDRPVDVQDQGSSSSRKQT